MMRIKELVRENNQLRQKLSAENRKFYEELLVQVRMKSIARDEKSSEETLLMILQDLLMAQEVKMTAEEYLGKDVTALAQEITSETNPSRKNGLKYLSILVAIYFLGFVGGGIVLDLIIKIFDRSNPVEIPAFMALVSTVWFTLIASAVWRSNIWERRSQTESFWKQYKGVLFLGVLLIAGLLIIAVLTRKVWLITF